MKVKILYSFWFILISLIMQAQNNGEWTQVGSTIYGAPDDNYGLSVSFNSDGSILAVSSKNCDANGYYSGQVKIFENQSGEWLQLGNDINGETAHEYSGRDISLSSDGSVVAIGAPSFDSNENNSTGQVRIFEYQSGNWIQKGQYITGLTGYENFGTSLSLNDEGSVIAIGAPGNDNLGNYSGIVRLYEYESGSWLQIGDSLTADGAGDQFGFSVCLNNTGDVVAIGAPQAETDYMGNGYVKVFENQTGNWAQIGSIIEGDESWDHFGYSVDLNSGGTVLAAGANFSDGNGTLSGEVKTFKNESGVWIQQGVDILGENGHDKAGTAVSLNSDGTVIAVGSPESGENGDNSGHVRVFNIVNNTWEQLGQNIVGEAMNDFSGDAISLNADGTMLAIGATGSDGNGESSGQIKVFEFVPSSNIFTENKKLNFGLFPNPARSQITIMFDKKQEAKIKIFDTAGKCFILEHVKDGIHTIDVSNLQAGIYMISVQTDEERRIKKFAVE